MKSRLTWHVPSGHFLDFHTPFRYGNGSVTISVYDEPETVVNSLQVKARIAPVCAGAIAGLSVEFGRDNRWRPEIIRTRSMMTTVAYDLPETAPVRIELFNILGQALRTLVNTRREAGSMISGEATAASPLSAVQNQSAKPQGRSENYAAGGVIAGAGVEPHRF